MEKTDTDELLEQLRSDQSAQHLQVKNLVHSLQSDSAYLQQLNQHPVVKTRPLDGREIAALYGVRPPPKAVPLPKHD